MKKNETKSVKETALSLKKHRIIILVLSFLIPVIIYFTVLMILGFMPNGDKTLLFMDLKGEYTEYLGSLRYIFGGDDSLFFNWSRSMGGNVTGLYAFYSGGLFAFISCLFSVEALPIAVEVITLIMIGLCGLTMAVFLEYGVGEKKASYGVVIFATCYALMSYNMVYANSFMWLNGCIFMPLIFLGIEQILKGKRGLIMYLSLAAAMINNYYTAYMICIFSVLYFVFRLVGLYFKNKETGESNFKTLRSACLRYMGMAVLSAMTAAPILLVTVYDLMSVKRTSESDYIVSTFYYPFKEVFKKLLPNQYDSITYDNIHPQLYAGLIVLIFAVLFFVIKSYRIREKIAAFAIVSILMISFWTVGIDKIWHGFQQPHWFPFRYAFVFGFFMVYLGYRAYDDIMHKSIFVKISKRFKTKRITVEFILSAVLIITCSVELGHNAANYINGLGKDFDYMYSDEYDDFLNKTKPLVDRVKNEDKTWYRMDKDYEFSKNDSMLLGYKGMTHYSSTYNASVINLLPRLGMAQEWYWTSGYGATPFMDALFGVKYRMAKKPMPDVYKKLDQIDDVTLYENTLALPLGFASNENILNAGDQDQDVFTNQNNIITAMMGDDSSCFKEIEYNREDLEGEVKLTLSAPNDQPLYMFIDRSNLGSGGIYVNDQYVSDYFSYETTCAVYLGNYSSGDILNISIRPEWSVVNDIWIVSMDTAKMEEIISSIKSHSLELSDFGAGSFEGTIQLDAGQVIATSLPYDDGQTVLVDGKPAQKEKWLNTFLAVRADPGEHVISVSYTPKGFTLGIILAFIGVMVALAWFSYTSWKRFIPGKTTEKEIYK